MPPPISGLTSLTDMLPGGLRVGAGQLSGPMSQMYTTKDPLQAMMKAQLARSLGRNARFFPDFFGGGDNLKYPPLEPEEEKSLWSTLGQGGMSGIGYVGRSLDKLFTRQIRAGLGGITGNVPWSRVGREMLSIIPYSDTMGITDPEDVVEGKDITGWDDPNSIWDDVAGLAIDVLADPLLFATFGAKAAAGKGLQSLSKAGRADDFFDAVKTGKFGSTPGMGAREAKMNYTLADVFKWADQEAELNKARGLGIRNDLMTALESEGMTRVAKGADLPGLDKYRNAAEHAAGGPHLKVANERYLNDPLGGLIGIGMPFRKPVTTVGQGPLAKAMARGLDKAGDAFVSLPAVRNIISLYDYTLRGALTRQGRDVARRTTRHTEEEIARRLTSAISLKDEIWRMNVGGLETRPANVRALDDFQQLAQMPNRRADSSLLPKGMSFGDMFDSSVVGAQTASENHRAVRRWFEGVDTELPEWFRGFGLEHKLGEFKKIFNDAADYARSYGVAIPDLEDIIDYLPRTRQSAGVFDKSWSRSFDVRSQHAIPREEVLKYHPGGTDVLMKLSVDKNISGLLHRIPRTSRGTPRMLPEAEMQKMRKYIVDNYWDELYGGDYARNYNPPEHLWKGAALPAELDAKTLTDGQLAHIVDPIIHWVARLDPRHAARGEHAFKLNPFDDVFRYIEHVTENAEGARAVHELFSEAAGFHGTMEAGIDAMPVADALRAVGLEGEQALRAFYETALGNRLSYERIIGRGIDVDEMRRFIDEVPDTASQLVTPSGAPFESLLIPREIVDDATRYLKPFSNPAELNAFIRAFDIFTNAFKTGVTTLFPAFHTRNFISGMFNNYVSGMADPRYSGPRALWQPLKDADVLMKGGVIQGASEITFITPEGHILTGLTDEQASRRLMAEGYAHNVHRRGGAAQDPTEVVGGGGTAGGVTGLEGYQPTISSVFPSPMFQRQPQLKKRVITDAKKFVPENVGKTEAAGEGFLGSLGRRILGPPAAMGPTLGAGVGTVFTPPYYLPKILKATDEVPGIKGGTTLWEKLDEFKPWKLRGVSGNETKFFAARWGEDTASAIEGYNRFAPYIAFRRQGMSAAEAARRVKAAQVDYSAMTSFERTYMKRLFPFYSFTRRMTPFIIEQLVQRPSGAIGQVLRETSRLRGTGPEATLLPPWVTRGAAIPLPWAGADGHDKYLMSLGLAHEDPLSMLHVGRSPWQTLSGTTRNLLSRINPLFRTPIEAATGKTLYGGGDLRFTKPAWAYARQNVRDLFGEEVPGWATGLFGPEPKTGPLHTLSSNLYPFAPSIPSYLAHAATGGLIPRGSPRYLTTERIVTDPRKSPWERIMDVSTGFKTGDVDVAQTRNLALSSALKDLLVEDSGVMRTEHIYAPEMEKLSSKNQILMRAYMQQARERQRIRRAMQEAEEGGDTLYPKLRRPTPESMFRAR